MRISELAILVERAERGDFCGDAGGGMGGGDGAITLQSRMETKPFTPEPNYRK